MATERAWTNLLRGYFTTGILPTLAPRDGDGFGAPRKTPPISDVRATLRDMLIGVYGAPLEETAEGALTNYVPSWDSLAADGRVWTHKWDAAGELVSVQSEPLP